MRPNLTLSQKGLILVCVPLIFQILLVAAIAGLHSQAEHDAIRAEHSKKISAVTNEIVRNLFDITVITRGDDLTRASITSSGYHKAMNEIKKELDDLRELVIDNAADTKVVDQSEAAAVKAIAIMSSCEAAYDSGNTMELVEVLRRTRKELRQCIKGIISTDLLQVAQQNREIEASSIERQSKFRETISLVLIAALVANALATIFVAWFFKQKILSRLNTLQDNSFRLAARQPLNEPLGGNDEISDVDRIFHLMAEALRESARKETAIIENAADVICSLDASGNFISVSPASQRVLHFAPTELVGSKFIKLFEPQDVDVALSKFQTACTGAFVPPFETRVVRGDGETIDILWSVHWSAAENSMFCVAHDYTDRKAAERMRQEVVAMVSHDLRNPLATVQGFLDMLETGVFGKITDRGTQLLSVANRNTSRMLTLAKDLLEIEKMESGMLEVVKKPVNLNVVFEHCDQAVQNLGTEKELKIHFAKSDVVVLGDEDRLIQIITNLLTNAIKFSPRESEVNVYAHGLGEFVKVTVKDNGRGIPAQAQKHIFDRFKQVEQSDAQEKEGTGLGLVICKALTELMGGTISVESEPGQGSQFSFSVPRYLA